jgi:hypothetical protein
MSDHQTLSAINRSLQALAIARASEADESILVVYTHSLADLPTALVRRACERLALRPKREFETALPDVGAIRETVLELQREDIAADRNAKLLAAPADADPRTWRYCAEQPTCDDSGHVLFVCPGVNSPTRYGGAPWAGIASCGRAKPHASHPFTVPCACKPYNPKLNPPAHAGAA